MGAKKYRLKGHESFALREGWITKGIQAVRANNKCYSINSGADALGVGTNMAKAIRYWMKTAGLTKESISTGVMLTEVGELIEKYDLYIEDIFSLWVMHINIASNIEAATSWNLFFNQMDLTSSFSRDDMFSIIKSLLIEYTGSDKLSDRSIRDDCAVIVTMYGRGGELGEDPEEKKRSPFEELGLISSKNNKIIKTRPSYDKINELLILYIIIERLNSEGNIPIDYLAEGNNMPGKLLNFTRIAINDYLDSLQNHGYIRVDRTAGLDIIYPAKCIEMNKEKVLLKYYEGSKG